MRILTCVFLATLAVTILAEPKPARVFKYQVADEAIKEINKKDKTLDTKPNASSGRLFMRKFFFKNMFGQNQNPPVITTGTDTTNIDTPTTTTEITTPTTVTTIEDPVTTNTDTVATATPIETNDPADPTNPTNPTNTVNPTDPINPTRRFQLYGRRGSSYQNDKVTDDEDFVNDEENLPAASAGAEEFIVTDQETKDISSPKANRAPARFNLRLRGGKRGQVINISLPAKYRGYFKNGESVALKRNRRTRPGRRRVIRRRKNRRPNNKNKNKKNKRRRFITV